ncbi:unnamed protein product, partial [Symbiodinium microadriaticum]
EKLITELNDTLEQTNKTFKEAQREMISWAQAKFEELNQKNDILVSALKDARSQLKNFSFNVQDDFDDKINTVTVTHSGSMMENEGKLLFPTEHGAEINSTLSTEKSAAAVVTSARDEKAAQRLLDSAIAAESSGEPIVADPEDNRTDVERMNPRQKWLWAFRKISTQNRVVKSGFGFTTTRKAKAGSVLQRLERMEQRMFFVPLEAHAFTTECHTSMQNQLQAEISRLETDQSDFSKATVENLQSLDTRIGGLTADISALQTELSSVQKVLDETVASQSKKLQDDIDSIAKKQNDDSERQRGTLRDRLQDLSRTFTSLQKRASNASEELGKVITSNSKLYKKNADDSISAILKVDTSMRLMREAVRQMEGDVFTLRTIGGGLREEAAAVGQDECTALAMAELDRILSEGLPMISSGIEEAKEKLKNHDDILANRWVSLSGMMKAISNISGISEKLEKLECDMENKVAVSEVQSIGKELASAALDEFQRPLDERMVGLSSRIEEHTRKIDALEAEVKEFPAKIVPAVTHVLPPQPTASSTRSATPRINISEAEAVSEVISQGWNPSEMEAQLHPLIKEIVNTYLAEWDNGYNDGGGYEDAYAGEVATDFTQPTSADIQTGEDESAIVGEEITDTVPVLSLDTGDVGETAVPAPFSLQSSPGAVSTPATVTNVTDMNDELPSSPAEQSAPAPEAEAVDKNPAPVPVAKERPKLSPRAAQPENSIVREKPPVKPANKSTEDKKTTQRSGPQGGSIDLAELTKLKSELKELQDKFLELNRSKIDAESVRALLLQKADMKVVDTKVENRVVSAIENAMGEVMAEIGNMKDMQAVELEKVKEAMAKRIKSSLKAMLAQTSQSSNG